MTESTNVDPLETRGRAPVRKGQTPPTGRDLARLSLMKFHSPISVSQWDDWQWQVRNQITTAQDLERWVPLSVEEKRAIQFSQGRFRFSPDSLLGIPDRSRKLPLPDSKTGHTAG